MMNRIFIFILVLIILLILYLLLFNNRHKYHHIRDNNIKNNIDSNFNQNSNDININTTDENNIELNDIQGYENEIMYISDDLKDGSYINQFKEIDYSKMAISNNQIGFNPEPKCSSGALPFVDINVNYLLNEK
jgi:hypothetical protein